MQPFAYIGPGGGVTVGLLVILIGGLVLFALGFIVSGSASSGSCAGRARPNGA